MTDRRLELIRHGYLYVSDENGAEIAGSRRTLGQVDTIEQYRALWRELELAAGDGCSVQHSETGKAAPW